MKIETGHLAEYELRAAAPPPPPPPSGGEQLQHRRLPETANAGAAFDAAGSSSSSPADGGDAPACKKAHRPATASIAIAAAGSSTTPATALPAPTSSPSPVSTSHRGACCHATSSPISALPHHLLLHAILSSHCAPADIKAWRSACRAARELANERVTSVSISGDHLWDELQSHGGGFAAAAAVLDASFPHLAALTLHDGCGVGIHDDTFQQLLRACRRRGGSGSGAPSQSLPSPACRTSSLCRRVSRLDLKRAHYLTPRSMSDVVSSFPCLEHLSPSRWVDTDSMKTLCGSALRRSLTSLDLGDADVDVIYVSDEAVAPLTQLHRLQELGLARCKRLTAAAIVGTLACLPQLRRLDLSRTSLTGAEFASLADGCALLEELDLSGCEAFGDEGLAAVAAISSLRRLRLGGTSVSDGQLQALQALPRLAALDLGHAFQLCWPGLRSLAGCPALEALTLGNFSVGRPLGALPPGGAVRQQPFPCLTSLKYSGAYFNRGLQHVFPISNDLQTLEVHGFNALSDSNFVAVAAQTSLASLSIAGGYRLSSKCLCGVASRLPLLRRMEVSACPQVNVAELRALPCVQRQQIEIVVVAPRPQTPFNTTSDAGGTTTQSAADAIAAAYPQIPLQASPRN